MDYFIFQVCISRKRGCEIGITNHAHKINRRTYYEMNNVKKKEKNKEKEKRRKR